MPKKARKPTATKRRMPLRKNSSSDSKVRPVHLEEEGDVIEAEAVPVLDPDAAGGDSTTAPGLNRDHEAEDEVFDHAAAEGRLPELNEGTTSQAAGGPVIPYDPLSRYLTEIRRFPLLSREEENVIARRYKELHDPDDAYRLVTANLRLVVKISNEFARASRNLLDLIQEGNVGLMEAVKNFDPYRGIRFPSYAVWWVRAYIYRYLINNWRLVKIGTTQAQRKLFFNLRKETERLEGEGFAPQPKLLAQRMGVKESEVREMQDRMAMSEVSLDQPIGQDEDATSLGDTLSDPSWSPEETASRDEWRQFAHDQVGEFAATLKNKEREIFEARLMSEDPPTLQEVGDRFNLSRERVRQIESKLKQRLREFIRERAADVNQAEQ